MKRKRITLWLLAVLLLLGWAVYWRIPNRPPALGNDQAARVAATPIDANVEPEEDKDRRRLLGVWHDDSQKNRLMTMTLKEDGTGKIDLRLSGWQATLFADRLRFDLTWTLKGKHFSTRTVGGEPADKVKVIQATRDTDGDSTILELTESHLLLLDKDGSTQYDWRR